MHDFPILKDLLIILAATLGITFIFHKIRLPAIMGYIIAGLLIGPYGTGLIQATADVEILAEIGIALLLFTVGLEFSLARMMKNLKIVLNGGGLQVLLSTAGTFVIAYLYGFGFSNALFFGFLVSLSSTAIVLKMCTDMGDLDAPSGRFTVGVLLFQDICVVPMMLLVPILGKAGEVSFANVLWVLSKSLVAVLVIFFSTRLLVPALLRQVVRFKSRESLILLVIFICMGTAWLTQQIGLSLAMGAFIAGLIISESEYSHQVAVEILPFRDFFSSIFFISIGMLLQIEFFWLHWEKFLLITGGIILLKAVFAFLAAYIIERSIRLSTIAGLRLAQVGEFSFLLAGEGLRVKLLDEISFQMFLGCAVLSMFVAPVIIRSSAGISHWVQSLFSSSEEKWEEPDEKLKDHVIIAGYGLNGKNLARILKETSINYIVVDIDGERVNQAKAEEVPVIYGDVTNREIIFKAGVKRARVIVYALSDPVSVRRGIAAVRDMNPNIFIITRTRYSSEVDELRDAGANTVIPMEFETSIEIFSRVLKEYNVPGNIINQHVEMIRIESYGMLRGLSLTGERLREFYQYLTMSITANHMVLENSFADEKTIRETELRRNTGVTILMIIRGKEPFANPSPDFKVLAGDLLVLLGSHAQLDKANQLLSQ